MSLFTRIWSRLDRRRIVSSCDIMKLSECFEDNQCIPLEHNPLQTERLTISKAGCGVSKYGFWVILQKRNSQCEDTIFARLNSFVTGSGLIVPAKNEIKISLCTNKSSRLMNVLKQYWYDSPQIWKNSLRILYRLVCFCAILSDGFVFGHSYLNTSFIQNKFHLLSWWND